MIKILNSKYLLYLSQILLSIIFIFSGIEKISDVNYFSISLNNYKIFPLFSQNIIVIIFPWIELIFGILLLFGFYKKEISMIFAFFLFGFIVLIFISILRGLDIECGCFGTLSSVKIGYMKIYENILLLIISLHIFFFGKEKGRFL